MFKTNIIKYEYKS